VEDCIKKYHPITKTILETACWTWVVAFELQKKWFWVTGLDISEKMLERAKKNLTSPQPSTSSGMTRGLPQGEGAIVDLVLWNMTNFDLKKKFDVVLCNYNSICHLLEWKQWQDFFDMSYNHLNKDWLLIFDINTLYEFESITRDFAQFYNFGDDTVCMEMRKTSPPTPLLRSNFEESRASTPVSVILRGEGNTWFIYEWLIKIFKKRKDKKYDLIEEIIQENSFEIFKIKNELEKKWFEVLEMVDFHYWEVTEISERVYFICKKIKKC
jgi:SAM-dependent methyltransferase